MDCRIISDSSSDILTLAGVNYACVPLKIITDEKEYADDAELSVEEMIADLQKYRGESKSSCPNVADWKDAFGGSRTVFCVTITSGLSGSYNAAHMAVEEYLQGEPGRKGYVIDTLSAGPEHALILEKLQELVEENTDFDTVVEKIEAYKEKTALVFSLDSLRNLANNGRVSMAVAKIAGLLGIRVIGKASEAGTLEVISKAKGSKKALAEVLKQMLKEGYKGGKVRIHHCLNESAATELAHMIRERFSTACVSICKTRALCSFYAEAGGFLVGFERDV